MKEIKNCPFCGGKAELIISDHELGDITHLHKILCEDMDGCGANLIAYLSFYQNDYEEALDSFIDRWNRIADGAGKENAGPEEGGMSGQFCHVPAVPHEMTAREFTKQFQRMCRWHEENDCQSECPFYERRDGCMCYPINMKDGWVTLVEQWAKEHPEKKRKTYAEDFFEKFPKSGREYWGIPRFCKNLIYEDRFCDKQGDRKDKCSACWNEVLEDEE